MIVIFDLDYTLFDTKKFKKDIAGIFNMAIRQFDKDYKNEFTDKKIDYTPYKHIRFLKKEKRIFSVKNYDKKIGDLVKNTNKYLYPKSLEVIKKFKKRGDKLILISRGDKQWQNKKINNSKIKKYFDKIILADKKKYLFLNFLDKAKDDILIINDNARESLKMKKAIGKCEVCLIRGPYSKNAKHNLKIHEIKDCLKLYD